MYEFTEITVTAKQHHNWSVSNISGTDFYAHQNENIFVTFNVTNTGNLIDTMLWSATQNTIQNQNDSTTWSIETDPERALNVNQTSTFGINITIPESSWEGSILYYNLSLISDSNNYAELNLKITVLRNSGWSLKLTESDLDVSTTGSNITIEIKNEGNAIVEPILIPVVPTGWNITNISSMTTVEPDGTISVNLHVIPPAESLGGEIGMMTLIVKDGDTLDGRSEIGVPLRVANLYSVEIGHEMDWIVSLEGGYPVVWLKNNGNALNEILIEISGSAKSSSSARPSFFLS